MFLLLGLTSFVMAASIIFGDRLLRHSPSVEGSEAADRLFLSFWCGLSIILGSLLVFCVFAPARYYWLFAVPAAGLLARPVLRRWRRPVPIRRAPLAISAAIAVLAVLFAWLATPHDYFDSFLYHYQLIDWMHGYGVVPGLALIHSRLGFVSSWFALSGSLEFGPLHGRLGVFPNALMAGAGALYSIAIIHRFSRRKATRLDAFWPVFFCLVTITGPDLAHSTAPEYGAALFIGGFAWTVLRLRHARVTFQGGPDAVLAATLVLIAAAALSIKTNAAVCLPAAAALWWMVLGRPAPRHWPLLAAALLPAIAAAAANFAATGCLNYPGGGCLDVPWGLGAAKAAEMSRIIHNMATWNHAEPSPSAFWLENWVKREQALAVLLVLNLAGASCALYAWLRGHSNALSATEAAVPVKLAKSAKQPDQTALLLQRITELEQRVEALEWRQSGRARWSTLWQERECAVLAAVAAAGLALCMLTAPSFRFGAGYAVLGWTLWALMSGVLAVSLTGMAVLWLGVHLGGPNAWLPLNALPEHLPGLALLLLPAGWWLWTRRQKNSRGHIIVSALLTLCVAVCLGQRRAAPPQFRSEPGNWLLPAQVVPLPAAQLMTVSMPDFDIFMPKPNPHIFLSETLCYTGNLPCTYELPRANLQLREPAKGLSGGFVKAQRGAPR